MSEKCPVCGTPGKTHGKVTRYFVANANELLEPTNVSNCEKDAEISALKKKLKVAEGYFAQIEKAGHKPEFFAGEDCWNLQAALAREAQDNIRDSK